MWPSMERTCFSPGCKAPTSQVIVFPSTVAPAVWLNWTLSGKLRVTTMSRRATDDTFSTSISRAIVPGSSESAILSERSLLRAGFVSSFSLSTSI